MTAQSEFPQHERLTRVLNIYRAAMRRRIAEVLEEKYGEDWFDQGLLPNLTNHQREEINTTRERFAADRAEEGLRLSEADERIRLLDIPHFLYAVKDRSNFFGELTDPQATQAMYQIYILRNIWSHPPLRDLPQGDVRRAAHHCVLVLELIDEDAADAVRGILEEHTDDAPPLAELSERIEDLQTAVSGQLPGEQLRGLLGNHLEATAQLHRELEAYRQQAQQERSEAVEQLAGGVRDLKEYVRDCTLTLADKSNALKEQSDRLSKALAELKAEPAADGGREDYREDYLERTLAASARLSGQTAELSASIKSAAAAADAQREQISTLLTELRQEREARTAPAPAKVQRGGGWDEALAELRKWWDGLGRR